MKKVNAVQSLYDASFNGKRNQTVLTPLSLIECIKEFWPEGIALDPCAARDPETGDWAIPATHHYHLESGQCGLSSPWLDRTYCNPPYNQLRKWLRKAVDSNKECLMLVPVRTHREWFLFQEFTCVAFLEPLKFRGYKSAFPAPLCLLYRGPKEKAEDFKRCFYELSTQMLMMNHWEIFSND